MLSYQIEHDMKCLVQPFFHLFQCKLKDYTISSLIGGGGKQTI